MTTTHAATPRVPSRLHVAVAHIARRIPTLITTLARHVPTAVSTIAGLAITCIATSAAALTVPTSHPRLWYGDPARLAQARTYYQTHPISIPGYPPSAAARNHALRHLMTGDPNECDPAIEWLMRFDMELSDQDGDGEADPGACDPDSEGLYCDRARWFGEDVMLTYDWCHGELTPAQRTTFINKWDRYIGAFNQGPYGWQERPINNYYWGFLRNSVLYGITTLGESTRAQEFIDHGINARFTQWFVPWANTFGRGGVPGEGTQYGPYPIGYSVVALRTLLDYGFDAYSATPFFDQVPYYLLYATSPAKTYDRGRTTPFWEMFPFNDDNDFSSGRSAEQTDYANVLGATILRNPAAPRARHARAWIARTGVQPDWWVRAAVAGTTGPTGESDIPLDYFAAGYSFLYARSAMGPDAMTAVFELGAIGAGERGGTEHDASEAGSFQFWRKGRFVSRESTGYRGSDYVKGLANNGRVDSTHPLAHNTVLFDGRGQAYAFHAQPRMLRLQSAEDYAYAAVNLRDAYRSHAGIVPNAQCWLAEDDWPFSDVVIREFIFLRDWNVTVALDRLKASDDSLQPVYANPCTDLDYTSKPATQVRKTFVLHFAPPTAPTVTGNRITGTNGDQALDAHLLLPAGSTPRIVDERTCTNCGLGQYRLEVDQTGTAEGYFLSVLHARDVTAAPITATLSQAGQDWTVTLTRNGGEQVRIKLRAGMASTGGSVQFGTEPEQPLLDRVQGMSVQTQGPVWEVIPSGQIFANGYE